MGGGKIGRLAILRLGFIHDRSQSLRIPEMLDGRIEVFRTIQIVLEQELNGAFSRLTSLTLLHQRWRRMRKWKGNSIGSSPRLSRWIRRVHEPFQLLDSTKVAPAFKGRVEPNFHDSQSEFLGNGALAE